MDARVIFAELECPNCVRPTAHQVHYVAGMLHRLDCQECGQRWDVEHRLLGHRYLSGLMWRIHTKPGRLASEARRRPIAFALAMPMRVVSKAARLAGEAGSVARVLGE